MIGMATNLTKSRAYLVRTCLQSFIVSVNLSIDSDSFVYKESM